MLKAAIPFQQILVGWELSDYFEEGRDMSQTSIVVQ